MFFGFIFSFVAVSVEFTVVDRSTGDRLDRGKEKNYDSLISVSFRSVTLLPELSLLLIQFHSIN